MFNKVPTDIKAKVPWKLINILTVVIGTEGAHC